LQADRIAKKTTTGVLLKEKVSGGRKKSGLTKRRIYTRASLKQGAEAVQKTRNEVCPTSMIEVVDEYSR